MNLSIEVYNPSRKIEFIAPNLDESGLEELFILSENVLCETLTESSRNSQNLPNLYRGAFSLGSDYCIDEWKKKLETKNPIYPKSPFENIDEIAGAVWSGRELFSRRKNEALIKLCFDNDANLPAHTHQWSDRVIFVVGGSGHFYASWQPFQIFSGDDMISFPVKIGDILVFSRGLVHTFGPSSEGLELYSFHSPFFDFEHPKQLQPPKTYLEATRFET